MAREPELADDRYQLERERAHGGMGTVYVAYDARLERRVAIKVVHPGDDTGRLLADARALAQLEHPGIVPVHDAGELADGRLYLVMKYVDGERLDGYARQASLGERLRVFVRIVDAIAFAHSRGIPHRDLKPHNVMVGPFGEVLVLDWGREGMGTTGWMAPEHAANGSGSASGDIFALGLMLRELTASEGQPALDAIAAKAAHATPHVRYATADDLRRDITRYLDLDRVEAFRETWWQAAGRIARRHRLAIFLLATYIVVRFFLILFQSL